MPNLDGLPYDVFYNISYHLDIDDIFHLASTCRSLRVVLDEATLCHQSVERCAFYSREAQLARQKQITYPQALQRIHNRRRALSTGTPFSACQLGRASDFLYSQGKICLVQRDHLFFQDILESTSSFKIPVSAILSVLGNGHVSKPSVTLLSFNDCIITILYEDHDLRENWLLAVDVKNNAPRHLIVPKLLTSVNKLFVRHTKDVLYYGTHSVTGSKGYKEWILQGVAFRTSGFEFALESRNQTVNPNPNQESIKVQLYDFPGSDVGSSVVFKIHDNYLYALSNCSSFDIVEVDWTSLYHVQRFPLDKPPACEGAMEKNTKLYRRQHLDGPVNDSWTDLSLQVDERTNELMIVEARKEWLDGASSQTRTFYLSAITFQEEEQGSKVPENDLYAHLSTSESNYKETEKLLPWQFHPEHSHSCDSARHSEPGSFILAHTPFQSYNLSCRSFIDIVTDPGCCGRSTHCIRLRAGSRREDPVSFAPSRKVEHTTKGKGKAIDASVQPSRSPQFDSFATEADVVYRYSPIYMWPAPSDTSMRAEKMHDILNPATSTDKDRAFYSGTRLKALADERFIIYMVKDITRGAAAEGELVCLCFDPEAAVCRLEELSGNSHAVDYAARNPTFYSDSNGQPGTNSATSITPSFAWLTDSHPSTQPAAERSKPNHPTQDLPSVPRTPSPASAVSHPRAHSPPASATAKQPAPSSSSPPSPPTATLDAALLRRWDEQLATADREEAADFDALWAD